MLETHLQKFSKPHIDTWSKIPLQIGKIESDLVSPKYINFLNCIVAGDGRRGSTNGAKPFAEPAIVL